MYKKPQRARLTDSWAVNGYPSGLDIAILTHCSARKSYVFPYNNFLVTKLARSRWLQTASFSLRVNILAYASKGPSLAKTLFGLVTQSSLITGRNDCVRLRENKEILPFMSLLFWSQNTTEHVKTAIMNILPFETRCKMLNAQ